ncbi:MAG: hypothetical protein R3E31_26760 [Chloroflexota bacterium]
MAGEEAIAGGGFDAGKRLRSPSSVTAPVSLGAAGTSLVVSTPNLLAAAALVRLLPLAPELAPTLPWQWRYPQNIQIA